ncbi:MAG: ABC transporter ATP-binding protein [Pseudanabaena sp. ELA607]
MLRVEQICKSYGRRSVLTDLSFEIKAGEVYGLLGPNGAGKTTTISILGGLVRPDYGRVYLAEHLLGYQDKYLIGIAPQDNIVYHHLTCAENLRFFAQLYGLRGRHCRQRVEACLEAVGLSDRRNCLAETLSGGMQRRLSMAIALVHEPILVVLDEPTTGLDIETRYEIWELIRKLRRQDMAILLTTHLLDEAERLCQRIGILKDGHLIAEGSLADLKSHVPAQEIVTLATADEVAVIARAEKLGFPYRHYGRELALWLPRIMELKEIIHCFDGLDIESITRQPVRLEHIYVELTQQKQDLALPEEIVKSLTVPLK